MSASSASPSFAPPRTSVTPEMADLAARQLRVSRLLNAPRELVFEVWTDPKHIVAWWGPNGFTTTISEMNVSKDGIWRFVMHGPDGVDYPNRVQFLEVKPPERLRYLHTDDQGNPVICFETEVTFEARQNKTLMTMVATFPNAEMLQETIRNNGAEIGMHQNADRMNDYVSELHLTRQGAAKTSNYKPFSISRLFAAPRSLVYQVWTQEEHLKHWWGPAGMALGIQRAEMRPGGGLDFSMTLPDGQTIKARWIIRELEAPSHMVFVSHFRDELDHPCAPPMAPTWPVEMLTTVTFTEENGRTTVSITVDPIHTSPSEALAFFEGHASMQQGWTGTLDALGRYLASV